MAEALLEMYRQRWGQSKVMRAYWYASLVAMGLCVAVTLTLGGWAIAWLLAWIQGGPEPAIDVFSITPTTTLIGGFAAAQLIFLDLMGVAINARDSRAFQSCCRVQGVVFGVVFAIIAMSSIEPLAMKVSAAVGSLAIAAAFIWLAQHLGKSHRRTLGATSA